MEAESDIYDCLVIVFVFLKINHYFSFVNNRRLPSTTVITVSVSIQSVKCYTVCKAAYRA